MRLYRKDNYDPNAQPLKVATQFIASYHNHYRNNKKATLPESGISLPLEVTLLFSFFD